MDNIITEILNKNADGYNTTHRHHYISSGRFDSVSREIKETINKLIEKLPKHTVEVRVNEDDPVGHGFSSHRELKEVILLDDLKEALKESK